jgi:excisionase family DNA binding protein
MQEESKTDTLLTVEEVSERLNVSPSFTYARISDGSLRHFRLGNGTQGGLRISEEQLAEYLAAREEPRTQEVDP